VPLRILYMKVLVYILWCNKLARSKQSNFIVE
jgi:hypothetical protein